MSWNENGKLFSFWVPENGNPDLNNLSNEDIRKEVQEHLTKLFKNVVVVYTVKDDTYKPK